MTLLLVVAHPDDETFAGGSVLLHAAGRGVRTVVVCASRGEAGDCAAGVELPPGGLPALRESELRAAADLLGVAELELLGLADSGMDGDAPAGSVCATPVAELAERVTDAVDRHRPSVVVVLAGDDGHRDHRHVRAAVESALEDSDVALYAHCLPRSLMHAWVLDRTGDDRSAAYVELPDIGTPDDDLTTVLDTEEHYATRREAIALHRSQHSPYEELPEDLRRRFLTAEHLVRLSPPWEGGERERELQGL